MNRSNSNLIIIIKFPTVVLLFALIKFLGFFIQYFRKRQENGKPLDIGVGPSSVILKEGNALGLHFVMFIPAIIGQGSTEQQNKWLPRALNLEIIGTYAQVNRKRLHSLKSISLIYVSFSL